MFRFANLAILMVGALMVTAGPVTKTCTEKTEPNGDVTMTCRDIGIILTWPNGTETVLYDWAEVSNIRGYTGLRSGNTYTYTRKANVVTKTCTEETKPNGDVTETCRDIGIIVTWADGTKLVLNDRAELSNLRGYTGVRSGNTYINHRKAHHRTQKFIDY